MSIDEQHILKLIYAIDEVIRGLTNDSPKNHVLSSSSREQLTKTAEKLAIAARDPEENLFSTIFVAPANRDMFKQMYDFLGHAVYTMPRFLESTQHRNPVDYNNSAFQHGHHVKVGFWEYLKEDPERAKVFNSGMRSMATIGGSSRRVGPYPFDRELEAESIEEADVAIVDVGGGRGQALEAIKMEFPALKGRMVLQDLPEVIEDAKLCGLPNFVEPMAVSFFESQPVKGKQSRPLFITLSFTSHPFLQHFALHSRVAISQPWGTLGALIYHFRRIFHDWSDDVSRRILCNTIKAMSLRSRILIADTIVPNIGAPRHVALQDINMMSFGGMERTLTQWNELLDSANLKIKRVWAESFLVVTFKLTGVKP
ncbi:MAG: hypothetical protein Q9172_003069 [Xanthocarpia lactea]